MAKATPGLPSMSGLNELKKRLLFVLLGIIIYRIGCHIPVPGLDPQRLAHLFSHQSGGILGLFNLFSGGALLRLTVFALGVMPYISASIIIQLFTSISPKLEQLKKEGEMGRRKINQYTRYGTFFLAFFQAIGLTKWLVTEGIALNPSFGFYFVAVITLVTGTMFLMWVGEQMTERGVGNGISLIIFVSIVSRFPSAISNILEQFREGQISGLSLLIIIAIVIAITIFVVFVERGQRRITINYAQRQQGRKMYAAQTSYLPLKLNMSGVIPPIFASSIILLPVTLIQWFGKGSGMQWLYNISLALQYGQPLYMTFMAAAVIFFAFFYTAMVFNPRETADNLKKSGAFIPGIRPGEQTSRYVDSVLTRLTMVGSLYLTLVVLLPEFVTKIWHVSFIFGGTSLLIVVVVIMDFMAQVQAHLMANQYDSLLKKSKLKGGSNTPRTSLF